MKKEWLDKSFELLKESPKTVGIYLTKVPSLTTFPIMLGWGSPLHRNRIYGD